jgi:ABC-2 type transport system permease protein
MIRSSLAAVPGRLGVLWGKALVFAGVTFGLMLVSAFIAFLGGQAIMGDAGASLSDPGVVRAIIGSAAFLTGAGLLGLALGALLRSTPAALSTYFGVMFLLGGIAELLLPESWRDNVGPYLPEAAGGAMGSVTPRGDNGLTAWTGLAVFLAYLAVVGGAAAWRLKRKDA